VWALWVLIGLCGIATAIAQSSISESIELGFSCISHTFGLTNAGLNLEQATIQKPLLKNGKKRTLSEITTLKIAPDLQNLDTKIY
jgi:hypothetical protein